MTLQMPRVRFAPSPTGELHVGNARTALFNWLFARRYGGKLVLRIEDTDSERTFKVYEEHLLEDLQWLSMDWDEGPGKDGAFGPYHQTERLDIYDAYLKKLVEADKVYPCYCTEEELETERITRLATRMTPRYSGKCRNLSPEERERLEREGRKPAHRFKVEPGTIAFDDLIRGAMKFEGDAIGDFIIVRSTGIPAYNFAVVVDDYLMHITHVIRGEDHLSNTAIQLLLYKELGFAPPVFVHHSLILGKDRTKLSKRHGSVSVREFRSRGFLPEAMVNYFALLGSSLDTGREVASIDEIIAMFSLDKAGKSGAIFDEEKLKWMNAIYIRHSDTDKLTECLIPFMKKAGYDADAFDRAWLHRVVEALRDNLVTLSDVGEYLDVFFDERYRLSEEAAAILQDDKACAVVRALDEALSHQDNADEIPYADVMKSVREKTGAKAKNLYMPVRAAVTDRVSGPELDKIVSILGRESVLKRLHLALEFAERDHT